MKNVFIIGNGFDLDLQMQTSFRNFASSSDYWPSDKSRLCAFLESQKDIDRWFDLEACLLEYISSESTYCPSTNCTFEIEQDKDYFDKLCQSLTSYINNEQVHIKIPNESVAKKVLKAIVENGYYQSIYSFNYTDLRYLANRMGITFNLEYKHLHGSIKERNIILGVNDRDIRKEYLKFRKANSSTYCSNDLSRSLMRAHEIVFFGLSFGNIDFCYFKEFFNSLSNDANRSERSKKWLTIFTKDEKSRLEIINNFESEGIMMSKLASFSNINFIYTHEDNDKKKLDDFIARQSIQSKENVNKKCLDALRF
jgi:hypothetical protein